MTDTPGSQINLHRLPFTDGTDMVEVDMPSPAVRLALVIHDGDIHVCALAPAGLKTRCERFRRYRSGQNITGIDSLNLMLGTVPKYVGTIGHGDAVWHVFHEPTPEMPGMNDLLRRYATAPDVAPTPSGGTTSA